MGTANSICIYLAHPPMQNLSLFDKLSDCFRHHFNRCFRVNAMLIEDTERFHSKITQRVFTYPSNICRSAVLLSLHLYAVYKLMPEFGGNEYTAYPFKASPTNFSLT